MATDVIKLNFINRSYDVNNSSIVVFQKNIATDFDELAIAWTVIQNCGRGDNHPFTYPMQFDVCGSDSYGNYSPLLAAYYGQAFEMVRDTSGDVLRLADTPAASPDQVEIRNGLQAGSIDGNVYRDGRLLAKKSAIAPGQKSLFEFKPRIFIGVVSEVEEGEVMNSAIIQQVNTEINLLGIESADIVMTGGGAGPNASPYRFDLAKINQS